MEILYFGQLCMGTWLIIGLLKIESMLKRHEWKNRANEADPKPYIDNMAL